MIKYKKADLAINKTGALVIMVLVIIFLFFLFFKYTGKSNTGLEYSTLQTKIELCRMKTIQSDFASRSTEKDTDDDGFFDSCDICLGYGLNDGKNDNDADNDMYPDDCDSEPSDDKKHECTLQLCQLTEGTDCEFKDQCCTSAYQMDYLAEGNSHLGLNEDVFECRTPG